MPDYEYIASGGKVFQKRSVFDGRHPSIVRILTINYLPHDMGHDMGSMAKLVATSLNAYDVNRKKMKPLRSLLK